MYTPYKCSTCWKGFSTNSHLRRHEASHTLGSSYGCYFCDRSFSRIDTARRHARKCPERGDRSMPRKLKRGKRKTSCDYCAFAKLACDEDVPCGTCLGNSLICTYSRVSGTFQSKSPPSPRISSPEEEAKAADTRECQESTDPAQKVRIPFLLNFYRETNSCRDFYTALESGRLEAGQRCESLTNSSEAAVVSSYPAQASLFEERFVGFPFFGFPGVEPWSQEFTDGKVSEAMDESPLFAFRERGEEIVKELKLAAAANNSGISAERAQTRLESAINQGLFSATNLLEYTHLYLQCFRRHCPILDLPVSHISCASLPLLLAIFLGGSVLSYPRDTYHLAIECFDLAEEYIFGLPVFKAGCKDHEDSVNRLPDLAESLIASVIIINFQVGRNDPGIRRRIRHLRFPALVSAARSLLLFQMNHQSTPFQQLGNGLTFKERESLIRTATYIFLLDCQFVACLRSPPLIIIAEFTGDLPCYEVQFSREEPLLSTALADQQSPSLVAVIDILMDDSQEGLENLLLRPVSVFGLFAVVGGLHSMIFSAFANRTIHNQLPRLTRALSRWNLLWENLTSQNSKDELGLVGFMMCGKEIWLLARALLQTDTEDFVRGLDCDSMVLFRSLVRHAYELSSRPGNELD